MSGFQHVPAGDETKIVDDDGDELDIDDKGRGAIVDTKNVDNLRAMNETLLRIEILLQVIAEG